MEVRQTLMTCASCECEGAMHAKAHMRVHVSRIPLLQDQKIHMPLTVTDSLMILKQLERMCNVCVQCLQRASTSYGLCFGLVMVSQVGRRPFSQHRTLLSVFKDREGLHRTTQDRKTEAGNLVAVWHFFRIRPFCERQSRPVGPHTHIYIHIYTCMCVTFSSMGIPQLARATEATMTVGHRAHA